MPASGVVGNFVAIAIFRIRISCSSKKYIPMTFQDDAIFHRVTTKLLSSVKWRQGLLLKYPADAGRNSKAATLLQFLANSTLAEADPAIWDRVKAHADQHYFGEVLSVANRLTGYSRQPRNINEYLKLVLEAAKSFAAPEVAQ